MDRIRLEVESSGKNDKADRFNVNIDNQFEANWGKGDIVRVYNNDAILMEFKVLTRTKEGLSVSLGKLAACTVKNIPKITLLDARERKVDPNESLGVKRHYQVYPSNEYKGAYVVVNIENWMPMKDNFKTREEALVWITKELEEE